MPSLGSLLSGFGRLVGTIIAILFVVGALGIAGWYGYRHWSESNSEAVDGAGAVAGNDPSTSTTNPPTGSDSVTDNSPGASDAPTGGSGSAGSNNGGSGTDPGASAGPSLGQQTVVTEILTADSGSTGDTKSFTILPDAQYHLEFAYSAKRQAPGVYATFGVKIRGLDHVLANESDGKGNSDKTMIRLPPGTYTLDIRADNCTWDVKVVETRQVDIVPGGVSPEEAREAALAEAAEQQRLAAEEQARREAAEAEKIESAKTRTWTTADGSYSVEATFVTFIDGTAQLKRTDTGVVIKVPLDRLSEADQDFIKNRRWLEAIEQE